MAAIQDASSNSVAQAQEPAILPVIVTGPTQMVSLKRPRTVLDPSATLPLFPPPQPEMTDVNAEDEAAKLLQQDETTEMLTVPSDPSATLHVPLLKVTLTKEDIAEIKLRLQNCYAVVDEHWIKNRRVMKWNKICLTVTAWMRLAYKATADHLSAQTRQIRIKCGTKGCVHPDHCDIGVCRSEDLCVDCTRVQGSSKECKTCQAFARRSHALTMEGYFLNLLGTAQASANQRKAKGREEAGIFTITATDLHDLWNRQQGRCYWSNLPLQLDTTKDWTASLERLNPTRGYVKDNIALIVHELNSPITWNATKLSSIRSLRESPVDMVALQKLVTEARCATPRPTFATHRLPPRLREGVLSFQCRKCNTFKERSHFGNSTQNKSGMRPQCKECAREQSRIWYSSLRGYVLSMVSHAKGSAATRSTKRGRTGSKAGEAVSITFDDILDLIIKQEGRCCYSRVPLVFTPNSFWMCSLERKDNADTYTKQNVRLSAWEFNTVKQWSKDKLEHMLQSLEHKETA